MNEETSKKLENILKDQKNSSDLFNANISEDEELQSTEESSYKKAFDYSIRILSLRDYSTHKMKQKLKERKYSTKDINQVIEKLLEYNYLRDEEFSRGRMKQLILKGLANKNIMHKLKQEHLIADEEEIEKIRNEQNLTSENQLKELIEKKLRYKEIPTDYDEKMKLKQKVMRFCLSKGYSYDEIKNHVGEYINRVARSIH